MKCGYLLGALLLLGCRGVESGPRWHFERMIVQPRSDAYRASGVFADGRVLQPPPPHTVARDQARTSALLLTGGDSAGPATSIPIPLTPALIELGQHRYNITCSPCHGFLGDAVSPVAFRMILRHPRSLHEAEVRALPPGRVFQVVRSGYGFMPSYAAMLTVEESWAVVAYVRALQLSQHAPLDSLPPVIRAQALQRLGTAPTQGRP